MQNNIDILTLDPLKMKLVSKVAPDCVLKGQLSFDGGLVVEGMIEGDLKVDGHLVIWNGGQVKGRVEVSGNLYVFGRFGGPAESASSSVLKCAGTAFVAHSARSTGTIFARLLQLYEGAELDGPFQTLK